METLYKISIRRGRKNKNNLLLALGSFIEAWNGEVVSLGRFSALETEIKAKVTELSKKYFRCTPPSVNSWAVNVNNCPCNIENPSSHVKKAFIGIRRSAGMDEYSAFTLEATELKDPK